MRDKQKYKEKDMGPFAGLHPGSSREGLLVFGLAAQLHRDNAAATDLEECLLPCWGQEDNLTDRWDARLLLDELALRPSHRRPGAELEADVSEEELDLERYRDLDPSQEAQLQLHGRAIAAPTLSDSPEGSPEREEAAGHRALPPPGFAAIPFNYGTSPAEAADQEEEEEGEGEQDREGSGGSLQPPTRPGAARPPSQQQQQQQQQAQAPGQQQLPMPGPGEPAFVAPFVVPEHLRRSGGLPATDRHFRVIQQTAGFVRSGGGQLEVLLRVKQAGNPLFNFLLPGDRLHSFYRWLVETRPEDLVVINAAPAAGDAPDSSASSGRDAVSAAPWRQQAQQQERREHEAHPSEQWRVPPEQQPPAWQQPPPWAQPQRTAAVAAAAPPPVYGPSLPQPDAVESLSLLSHYDDEWAKSPRESQQQQQQQEQEQARQQGPDSEQAVQGQAVENLAARADLRQQQQEQQQGHIEQGSPAADASAAAGRQTGEGEGEREGSVQHQDGEQPPEEMLAVMKKLVAFVQKNGAKFEGMVRAKEAKNPLFAFLMPESKHHSHYRALLAEAVGASDAQAILDIAATATAVTAAPATTVPTAATSTAAPSAATASAAAAVPQATSPPPPAAATPAGGSAADGAALSQPPPWARGTESAGAQGQQQPAAVPVPETEAAAGAAEAAIVVPAPAQPGSTPAAITLPPWLKEKMVAAASATAGALKLQANPSIVKVPPKAAAEAKASAGGGEVPSGAAPEAAAGTEAGEEGGTGEPSSPGGAAGGGETAAEAEAEERKKAERRRRARELLLQRQQEAALAAARQRQEQLSAISVHRTAFLAEDGGEVAEGAGPGPSSLAAEGAALGGGRAAGPGRQVEEVEEGEIALPPPHALGVKERQGGVGVLPPREPLPRVPSDLPLVEDLVTLRMRRASSAQGLAAPIAAPAGQQQAPQQRGSGSSGLLPPPGRTIASHRAAFGGGQGALPAGVGSGGGSAPAEAHAADQQQRGAEGPALQAASEPKGEAALHLRRIRDRIAAMTAGSRAAAEGGGAGGASSRPGSALSSGAALSAPQAAPSAGTSRLAGSASKGASDSRGGTDSEGEGRRSRSPSRLSRRRRRSRSHSSRSSRSSSGSRSRSRSRSRQPRSKSRSSRSRSTRHHDRERSGERKHKKHRQHKHKHKHKRERR